MPRTNKQPSFFPKSNDWRMANIWNLALVSKADRPMRQRDNLWASELGKANIELFLKMRGVEPTNPPNDRSKRKFEAGNILKRAGILKDNQKWVPYQYDGLLQVTGKIDYIAGGIPDYENYKAQLEAMELPEFFLRASESVIQHFGEKYPEGLADMPLEIKSCSSFMMDSMERTGNASKNHRLQLFHYLKSLNFPAGNVVYICRDDLRMFEVRVENPGETEQEYKQAIEEITKYYNAHKDTPIESFLKKPANEDERWIWIPLEGLPPLEKNLVWDEDLKKFARNWGVEYSSYLTMLYGYKTQLEFEEEVMPIVSRWNRVLSRMKVAFNRQEWLKSYEVVELNVVIEKIAKTAESKASKRQYIITKEGDQLYLPDEICKGYEMTPKNLEVINEMQQAGFDPILLAPQYAGTAEEEEVTV